MTTTANWTRGNLRRLRIGAETEGFGLEVDGRMKTVFPTLQAAQKRARNLKAEFPMLQIKVYDAAERTRTLVELPPGKVIPIEE